MPSSLPLPTDAPTRSMGRGVVQRALYSALLRLLTPAYLARLWWRGRKEPGYREALAERLGFYAGPAPRPGALWLHAVSLGETRAAAPLIEALRAARPGLRLVLTHSTATGRTAGQALLRAGDIQTWLPYDTPGAVTRFLRRHRPALGVLMETEVWPNLLHRAAAAGVPVVLANARLSERSLRRGLAMEGLMKPAAQRLHAVLAQSEADAQRLRRMGAAQVEVCGNLKFDIAPSAELLARGRAWRQASARPVVLAAVTREGEEAPLLAAWAREPAPRPLLVLVPRHPQRFDEVAGLVRQAGFTLMRRSQWADAVPDDAKSADVWLGDSMGEMPLYYGLADVALLGGSFAPLGGQNLIEAAACGCPLLMGPHTFNFAEAAALAEAAGAAQRVPDIAAAVRRASALVLDTGEREAIAQKAMHFAQAHKGATARMAGIIAGLLVAT
jgi:3-deoxy-D-manno-octulosonic-acid transferase